MKFPSPSLFAIPVFATLVGCVFAAVYIAGMWYVKHLQGQVQMDAALLAGEIRREASLRNLAVLLSELQEEERALRSFFVAPQDAVTLIERVEALGGADNAVSISDVHMEEQNEETGEGAMIMSVSSTGTWEEMSRLLALLDTFPYASRLEEVSLQYGAVVAEGEAPTWTLRGTLRIMLRA